MEPFIIGLLPLILFVLIDTYQGGAKGVMAAIGLSFLMVIFFLIKTMSWDWIIFGEFLLIFVLGLISIRLNDTKYFKLQPAILAVIFAVLFTAFQLMGKPLLIVLIPHVLKLYPEMERNIQNPQVLAILSRVSLGLIVLFVLHGLAVFYASIRLSSKAWLGVRLAFYPGFLIVWFWASHF